MKVSWSKLGNVAANVATLGGHGKLKNAQSEYSTEYQHYKAAHEKLNRSISIQNEMVERVGETTEIVVKILNESQTILSKFIAPDAVKPHLKANKKTSVVTQISSINQSLQAATNLAAGSAIGGTVTMGSWALVSMLGTASTGTAIGGLSGVAATNATLAWFGGGSLATGGAGMAGGGLVLGGILAVPIIAFSAWKSYSSAGEVEGQCSKLKVETSDLKRQHLQVQKSIKLIRDKHQLLKIGVSRIEFVLMEVKQTLFKNGIWSKAFRRLRKIFGGSYYTVEDHGALNKLEREIRVLLSLLVKE